MKYMVLGDILKKEQLMEYGLGGAYLYLGKKLVDYVSPYLEKNTKQYTAPVIKGVAGVVSEVLPWTKTFYLERLGNYLIADAVKDIIVDFIDKPAMCWVESATSIHCINFPNLPNVTDIYIDGTALSSASASISGSASDFTITLATSLSTGDHELVILAPDKRFSFYRKIYV
ncbi:MAG: hypothetical protein QXT28_10540 [Thermofilaceae archaeon]